MRIRNGKVHKDDVAKVISMLVTAGISPILYHWTQIHSAARILEGDEFQLTPALGTGADKVPGQKLYFLSCSRIKHGGYARAQTYKSGVEFVLDGAKLSQRYTGTPVDYWGTHWREGMRQMGGSPEYLLEQYLGKDENEDRVFSDDPTIPAKRYIKEVHILSADDIDDDQYANVYPLITKILRICKTSGIECYLYNSIKDFKSQNKNKSIPFSELGRHVTKPDDFRKRTSFPSDKFDEFIELYYATDKEKLGKKTSRLSWDLQSEYRKDSIIKGLEVDIHNCRHGSEEAKKELHKLLALFKKEGVRTIRDFIEILADKAARMYKTEEAG